METLLQKAKKSKGNRISSFNITREDLELCLAWIKNEVTSGQVAHVKDYEDSGQRLYQFVTRTLKYFSQQGWLAWEILEDYSKPKAKRKGI